MYLKCFFFVLKKKMHHVLVSSINSKEFLFFGYLKQKKKNISKYKYTCTCKILIDLNALNKL